MNGQSIYHPAKFEVERKFVQEETKRETCRNQIIEGTKMAGIKSKTVEREANKAYIFLSSLSKMADLSRPSDDMTLPRPPRLASPRLTP